MFKLIEDRLAQQSQARTVVHLLVVSKNHPGNLGRIDVWDTGWPYHPYPVYVLLPEGGKK